MSRTRNGHGTDHPTGPADEPPRRSWWRSAGRATVRLAFALLLEDTVSSREPSAGDVVRGPEPQTEAERIAALLHQRRRYGPWFLGFLVLWGLATGIAAAYSGWGAPPWAWGTLALAVASGAVFGVVWGRRSLPRSVDDAVEHLRRNGFRASVQARPDTTQMAFAVVFAGVALAPLTGLAHGIAQADLWALDGSALVAVGLTMYAFTGRTVAAIAVLPEAQQATSP